MQNPVQTTLRISISKLIFILSLAFLFGGLNNNVYAQIYVDADAAGAEDGTSWTNAYKSLQDALAAATGSDEIWIAEGTYYPDEGGNQTQQDRSANFYIPGTKNGIKIFGGFSGEETALSQRDLATHKTILSGDIDQNGSFSGNSFHVVFFDGIVNTPPTADFSIDGTAQTVEFTNQSADPDGSISSYSWEFGDGSTSTEANPTHTYNSGGEYTVLLSVKDNHGAGATSTKTVDVPDDADPPTIIRKTMGKESNENEHFPITNTTVLADVTITGGNANGSENDDLRGAGIFCDGNGSGKECSPTLQNLIVVSNQADSFAGGLFNDGQNGNASPRITNVLFVDNRSGSNGGAMYNYGRSGESSPSLTGVTFVNNQAATNGGGMYNYSYTDGTAKPVISNSIFYGNIADSDNDETGSGNQINNDGQAANPVLGYSLVEGGVNGIGHINSANITFEDTNGNSVTFANSTNISGNPEFKDSNDPDGADDIFGTNDDGLLPQDISPLINAGSNTPYESGGVAESITTDLAGNTRIYDGSADPDIVDIGAYEYQGEPAENDEIEPGEGNILYVDKNVTGGTEQGNSWDNAISELADALLWARTQYNEASATWNSDEPLQIWVATGTYLPMYSAEDGNYTEDGGRSNSFVLVPDVQVFGGFDPDAGIETLDDDRLLPNDENGTILSGDIGTEGDESDNANHVVISAGTIGSTVLNGLTLSGGYAFADPGDVITVNEETVHHNRGGGIFISNSSPRLSHLLISNNSANEDGGGVHNLDSSPAITNVIFEGNFAGYNGGGMNINTVLNTEDSSPTFTNVVFAENKADEEYGYGGALSNGGAPIFTNVTFTKNISGSGGAIYNAGTLSMTNSIIWGNDAPYYGKEIYNSGTINLYYSLYREGEYIVYDDADGFTADEYSITSDPQFTDADAGNYSLQSVSPAIKAGDPDTDLSLFPTNSDDNPVDLAGNPRVKNATIDIGSYEFQNELAELPEGEDGRVLVSNQDPYIFSMEDFSLSESVNKVNILSISGKGSVALDENEISPPREIPVDDIRDGLLTFEASGKDSYGYNYAEIEFEFIGSNGQTSEQITTLSIDVGTTKLELTGNEGWRFIGNPSDGDDIAEFLDPIWIQGMVGSDSPDARFYNIFILHRASYEWAALGDLSEPLVPGASFIVYVFSDDNNDGDPEGFPKTLTSGQNWESLENSFVYQGLNYYPDQGPQGDSHILLANPHPFGINFCDMYNEESVNVANSIDIWDPSANDGNGDYINLNCSVEDVFIAPFQGFWIRTTNRNPELEIPKSSYLETTVVYFKESKKQDENLFNISMTISDEQQVFSNQIDLFFSDEASSGTDHLDAPKLSPEGLAERWVSFYSVDEENNAYSFQSLPNDFEEKKKIPLDIQTTESGRFTLDWTLPGTHVFSGNYFLRDNQTGEVIELRQGSDYSFEIDPSQAMKVSGKERSAKSFGDFADLGGNSTPRFELLITATGVDGLTELGAVPEEFTLDQNYPNPFNPTTVIKYQLPVSSEVRLEVYDMLGRNVATLVNEQVAAGRHTVNFDASNLSSGVYLYRLQAGSQIMTKKLTILK